MPISVSCGRGRLRGGHSSCVARCTQSRACALHLCRNADPAEGQRAVVPLWREGPQDNAVGVAVRPDGMITLEAKNQPVLAFLIKETKQPGSEDAEGDM